MSKSNLCLTVFVALMLLFAATLYFRVNRIETDLTNRSVSAAKAEGHNWAILDADGRDLTLKGEAVTAEARTMAFQIVKAVWGVRTVDDQATVAVDRAALPIPAVSPPRDTSNKETSAASETAWRVEKRGGDRPARSQKFKCIHKTFR